MSIRESLKKLLYGNKYSSDTYIQYLKKIGVTIGEDVTIYSPRKTVIDETQPFLLSIGNHVKITEGSVILTHDYAWSVLKNKYGAILGSNRSTTIGNNVYIGMNTIITAGVTIGDNVIIGAGSIVTNNLAGDYVYAGNPAKPLFSLDIYYKRRKEKQKDEAMAIAKKYYEKYKVNPDKKIFYEYFMLFEDKETVCKTPTFENQMKLGGSYELSLKSMQDMKQYTDFKDFLYHCNIDETR